MGNHLDFDGNGIVNFDAVILVSTIYSLMSFDFNLITFSFSSFLSNYFQFHLFNFVFFNFNLFTFNKL